MKNSFSLSTDADAVELTAILPENLEAKGHPSTSMEQAYHSDDGNQIMIEARETQKESFQTPLQKTLDIVQEPASHEDEKKDTQPVELIKSQEVLNSSFSVRELSPSTGSDVVTSRSALSIDAEMPSQMEEKADALYIFLNSLGINSEDLQREDIPEEPLRQLFRQETSCTAAFKWSRFERLIDNGLHGLLLSRGDLMLETKKSGLSRRVRPHEHSILLRHRSSLRKAYAVSEFVDGIRWGVLGFVRAFITSMLLYRLGAWASSGQHDFSAFEALFSGNNQKGINSLTGLLAKLNPSILRFILTSPLILGATQSLLQFATARQDSEEKVVQRIQVLAAYLLESPRWWGDVIREGIPLVSRLISVSEQIHLLAQSLNWNGRLTRESRVNAFAMIRQIAQHGRKIPQWTAMDSLARLQDIALKDFPLLQTAGYDKSVLMQLLYTRVHAFADLVQLAEKRPGESAFRTLPRRLYASYLLWWLGQAISWWRQRLPFFLLKASALALEIYFFYNIASSLRKAIECPDKPGYQFGEGYLPWAPDYSSECLRRRIVIFNIQLLQTTQQLVAEIPRYHLADFVDLELGGKGVTAQDVQSIIKAVVAQGAPLQSLELGFNPLNQLPLGFFASLTQLQSLSLNSSQLASLVPGLFARLTRLQYLDLSNNFISNLSVATFKSLDQLQALYLGGNRLNSLPLGIFTDLNQLQLLDLSSLQMSNLSSNLFIGLSQLQSLLLYGNPLYSLQTGVFTYLSQLHYLDLSSTQLRNLSASAFNGLSQLRFLSLASNFLTSLPSGLFASLGQLQALDLCGNLFNTSTMIAILASLPTTLTMLNISNNAMINLPNNMLSLWLPALRILSVGGNPFVPATLTPVWMGYFPPQLTSFSLGASRSIVNLSTGTFAAFKQLQFLNLSYNLLSSWQPNVLSGLSQLQGLDLSGNLFTDFTSAAFSDAPQLQSLTLTGNLINNLSEDTFFGLNQLQQLDLSRNLLDFLPAGLFSNLYQLQFLDLSFNNLVSAPAGLFDPLNQLQWLNVSSNLFSSAALGIYTGLRQLKILDVSFNEVNLDLLNNITEGFPYQINQLIISVSSRNGTYYDQKISGWIVSIMPCLTQINTILIKGDIAGFIAKLGISFLINLENIVLQQLLKTACESQLCHANLPPQQLCHPIATPSSQMVTPASYSNRFLTFEQSSQQVTAKQSTQLTLPYFESSTDFYFPNSSLTPVLSSDVATLGDHPADDSFTGSLSTPTTVGATIIGIAGLSILFYKNSTWIKAIVDTTCRFMQRCCEKATPATTTKPLSSPEKISRRYALFKDQHSSAKKVSTSVTSSRFIPVRTRLS